MNERTLLSYKGKVNFDSYTLSNEADDRYEDEAKSLEGFSEALVFVCPCCIKKFNLYDELDTTEVKNDAEISYMKEADKAELEDTYVCCVEGCDNAYASDCTLNLDHCEIIKETEKQKEKGREAIER